MNPYIEEKIEEFNITFKVVANQFRELIFIMKRRDDVLKLEAEELLHKQELWLRETLEDVWNEAIKTSNSGRKMYELGRKEEREEIQGDIKSILNFLAGNTERKKIVNFIEEYLLK